MSYATKEISTESGAPILLYHFVQGTTDYRYSATTSSISLLSQTWTPAVIQPGAFSQTQDFTRDMLHLKLPIDNALALTFLGYAPDAATTLTVYRAHIGETDAIVYWKGRVASTQINGNEMTLECEPIFSSLQRQGLRAVYQRMCRWPLYGLGCGLVAATFADTADVTEINGLVYSVPDMLSVDNPGPLTGGVLMAPDGTKRAIVKHEGFYLTLKSPIKSLITALQANPTGVEVTLYPGCDRTPETCQNKFGNLGNFGGCPYIPGANPFEKAVL